MERQPSDSPDTKDKIILPEPLQRAMIAFFRDVSALKLARSGKRQQTLPNPNELEDG
jgi:hypothetical protein